MFLIFNVGNIVFAVGTITVSYLAWDWAVKNTLIPVSLMQKFWPEDTAQELLSTDGDYLIASEELSKRFWSAVDQSGLMATLGKKKKVARKSTKKDPEEEGGDQEEETYEPKVRRYASETVSAKSAADHNQTTMLKLAFVATGAALFMVILAIIGLVKDLMVSLVWVGALVLIAGIVGILLKLNSMKASKTLKGAFNVLYTIIIIVILGFAGAWSVPTVRNGLLSGAGIGNFSGLQANLSGALNNNLIPTLALPENSATPTTTATSTPTLTPEPEAPKIKFVVGEYSLEVKEMTNSDMAQDLSIIVESINSVTAAYRQATDTIKAENGNMANWAALCYGSEDQQRSIAEVSIQNRAFLNVGITRDGQPVLSYFDRLATLKDTKAIKPEDATQLEELGKLLNGILEEHEQLCSPLTEMETMGKAADGDYTLVDQNRVAELFAQAKDIAVRINDVAQAFNERKQEAMARLEKLEGPDGQDLIGFLEEAYPADTQDIYMTATPGVPAPNIVNTLLPPTATPTTAPTQDACRAATTTDEGKSWAGYEWGVEEFLNELSITGYMDVERYVPDCGGFVVSFPDVTGDGIAEWGIVQEIRTQPAYKQYGEIQHDQTGFRLIYATDPLWPDGNEYYIYREDNEEIVRRKWPVLQATDTPAPQACRPADTASYGDWNILPLRWQELATALGGDGKAMYRSCGNGRFYITVETYWNRYWFEQSDTPPGINEGSYFWVGWNGDPYYWAANPTATPTPPSAEMCRPGRSDVFTDSNKVSTRWQDLDGVFPNGDSPSTGNFAWYYRCRPDAIYVVIVDGQPGDAITLFWLTQTDNPSNIGEGQTFWVKNGSAYLTSSQFEPPAR